MNRTSKTRSASSGTPYLKPKLISWMTSRSGRRARPGGRRAARAARAATGPTCRARRRPRRGPDRAPGAPRRSSWRCPRWSASGWRWRVSEKRRMRTSSRASRKKTWGWIPRPSSAPRTAARASDASPARTSSTMATRSKRSRSLGHELGQVGQELAGQVVDAGVAEVLEQLRGGRLAGPRQPAQDHDVLVAAPRIRGDRLLA